MEDNNIQTIKEYTLDDIQELSDKSRPYSMETTEDIAYDRGFSDGFKKCLELITKQTEPTVVTEIVCDADCHLSQFYYNNGAKCCKAWKE